MAKRSKPQPPDDATSYRFQFDRLVVTRSVFEVVDPEAGVPDEDRPARIPLNVTINGAIEVNPQTLRAIVTLHAIVDPDRKWQPYHLEVIVKGLFAATQATPAIFDQFCRHAAPPILFPYVREHVHRLTMDAPHGPVLLEPINVQALLATWQASAPS